MIKRLFILIFLFFLSAGVEAASLSLSTDRNTISVSESFRVYLKIELESGQKIEKIEEPSFGGFSIQHRGQSQSSSFNMINGKMSYSKSITYTYVLYPEKQGEFSIGPARIVLESGKKIPSETVDVRVTNGGTFGGSGKKDDREEDDAESYEEKSRGKGNDLEASLSSWEKRTPRNFVRTIVAPSGDIYKGEPVTVSYYLFAKSNSVSDVSFYKLPEFHGCWKDDSQSPSRLDFNRIQIDGNVYDYALLKEYVVIPGTQRDNLTSTQLILDIKTGGFFNTQKKRIASVALNMSLKALPESEEYSDAVYGDFSISADKNSLTLNRNKVLENITYTVQGCGNIQAVHMPKPEVDGVMFFEPDINSSSRVRGNKYCGKKSFTFILRGEETGKFTVPGYELSFFSRDRGYYKLKTAPLEIEVSEIPASERTESEEKKVVRYEFLRKLPSEASRVSLVPVTKRLWFLIMIFIPLIGTALAVMLWLLMKMKNRYTKSRKHAGQYWKKMIMDSKNAEELMNRFYKAFSSVHKINLKGMREKELNRTYSRKAKEAHKFVTELQRIIYSKNCDAEIKKLKKEAYKIFSFAERDR